MDKVKDVIDSQAIFTGEKRETVESRTNHTPVEIAREVLNHRAASVRESVTSAEAYTRGLLAFQVDEQRRTFLQVLVDHKVLSSKEMAQELKGKTSSAKTSKYKKIREFSFVILDQRILPYLEASYSTLYQLILLYEDLPGDPDEAISALQGILKDRDGPITRKWIDEKRKELTAPESTEIKQPSGVDMPEAGESADREDHEAEENVDDDEDYTDEDIDEEDQHDTDTDAASEADERTDRDDAYEASQPIVAVLLDSESLDWDPAFLRKVADDIADDAALVIVADAASLCVLARTAEIFGFDKPSSVYLISKPAEPNITGYMAIAVFERGTLSPFQSITDWPDSGDPIELAGQMLVNVSGRQLYVSDRDAVTGWETFPQG